MPKSVLICLVAESEKDDSDYQWFRLAAHMKESPPSTGQTAAKRPFSAGDTAIDELRSGSRDKDQKCVRLARSSSSLILIPEEELKERITTAFSYRRKTSAKRKSAGKSARIDSATPTVIETRGSPGFPSIQRQKRPLKSVLVRKTESPVLGLLDTRRPRPTDGVIRYEYHAPELVGNFGLNDFR